MPRPDRFALPSLAPRTVGLPLATEPLTIKDASSMVWTSRFTPPRSFPTTSMLASAMNGCARRIRSDSARRSSEHRPRTCSNRNRRMISSRVTTCVSRTTFPTTGTRRNPATVGASASMLMESIRCPRQGTSPVVRCAARGDAPAHNSNVTVRTRTPLFAHLALQFL